MKGTRGIGDPKNHRCLSDMVDRVIKPFWSLYLFCQVLRNLDSGTTHPDRNPNDPLPIRQNSYEIQISRHEVAIRQTRLDFTRLPMFAKYLGRLERRDPESRRGWILWRDPRVPRTQQVIVAYHKRRGARDPEGPRRLRQPRPVRVEEDARRSRAPISPWDGAHGAGLRIGSDDGQQGRDADGHPATWQDADARRSHFVLDEKADRADFGGSERNDALPRQLASRTAACCRRDPLLVDG